MNEDDARAVCFPDRRSALSWWHLGVQKQPGLKLRGGGRVGL
jgi:hypothetical protein